MSVRDVVEGEAQVRAALRALPMRIESMILAKALRAGGNELRRAVRAATPVRGDDRLIKTSKGRFRGPGNLRKAWRVSLKRESGHLVAYLHPGASGFYGYFLEVNPGLRPFFAAAVNGAQPAAAAKIVATMRAELSRAITGNAVLASMVSRAGHP